VKVRSVDRFVRFLRQVPWGYPAVVIRIAITPNKNHRELPRIPRAIILSYGDFHLVDVNARLIGPFVVVEIQARLIGYLIVHSHVQDQFRIRIQAHAGIFAVRRTDS